MGSRAALVLAAILLAPTALAAPSAAERETARRLMDEGKKKTRTKDLEGALSAYEKAHAIMHVPTTGLALATTQMALGNLIEAREAALEVIRMPEEKDEPAVFGKARDKARELDAQLKERIPTVMIAVDGGPATEVTVDGIVVAPALLGAPVALNPGTREIVARNADGASARTTVELSEKDTIEVTLTLPAPAVVTAREPRSGASWEGEASSSERTPVANVLVLGGFGVAVAGAVLGSVTGALAFGKAGDVKPQCENGICDPAAESDLEGARTMATVSTVGFAVAGAGALAGIAGLLLPRTAKEPGARQTSLWFGPAGGGIRGTF
jgi:hypothetical protein